MTIHRRTLLKSSIPALAGSIALGAVVEAATPIQQLYTQWQDAAAKYERLADEGEARLNADRSAGNPDASKNDREHEARFVTPAYSAMVALEDQIMKQPVEAAYDLAIKVIIALRVEDAHDTDQYRRLHSDAVGLLA